MASPRSSLNQEQLLPSAKKSEPAPAVTSNDEVAQAVAVVLKDNPGILVQAVQAADEKTQRDLVHAMGASPATRKRKQQATNEQLLNFFLVKN